ncbi:MAG TPA: ergothioneine biosynthesis protein EgtB [Pirellulaceae bacterium]|jgi:ergothioneine biosynthesis protein EgtB|nr:ergothioneine biosynthesis protein EgtB [Pirellulaceae bacterium]
MATTLDAKAETDDLIRLANLTDRFRAVRDRSAALCRHLPVEDLVVQSMLDASPLKWHLAHTTWFFETFLLKPRVEKLVRPVERSEYLFNSYYEAVGDQFPREQRGLLSRPTAEEVFAYRRTIDDAVLDLLESTASASPAEISEIAATVEIGLQHEQQHQELMLTDVKHLLSLNPLYPAYRTTERFPALKSCEMNRSPTDAEAEAAGSFSARIAHGGGIVSIGRDAQGDFCFDNETPRHQVLLRPFEIAARLTTNGDFLAFVLDGGYRRPELWLSLGWATVRERGWKAPLYWHEREGELFQFTLDGLLPLDPDAPAMHLSYFEADAYARWREARLPTEAEWETLACERDPRKSHGFVESGAMRPTAEGVEDWFGQVWQWTSSSYSPYPGYRPWPGAVGEYNGKFMCNQYVLRGGSCATPADHVRATYRNFFPPDTRWQFSGMRIAFDG